jgi:predicted Rossmann fold flavoprotein
MNIYDVAVVGAGPAGIMASISAARFNKKVVLIERNSSIGRKILLTGGGRCNFTNSASLDMFLEKFGKSGLFLRTAFLKFGNKDLMQFFKEGGLQVKREESGKVFPVTDSAKSVVSVLEKYLKSSNAHVFYNSRVKSVEEKDGLFQLDLGNKIIAKKVIFATGGASYKKSGSSGDGYNIARRLGHTISPLLPGLVPLKIGERWIGKLKGVAVGGARISFVQNKKKVVSQTGDLIFTHFGISGPLVLDISSKIAFILEREKKLVVFIDFKPALKKEQLERILVGEIETKGKRNLKNIIKIFLPEKLVSVFIQFLRLNPEKKANQINKQERFAIINLLKRFPLTVVKTLPLEEAMVTCGGILAKEINARTFESKIIPGLYFAGEIIEGCACSGGFNLQQAFSTGFLAGEEAAKCAE